MEAPRSEVIPKTPAEGIATLRVPQVLIALERVPREFGTT